MTELIKLDSGLAGAPTEHEYNVLHAIASNAHESKLYRSVGDQTAILMTILAARELGIPPMLALNGGIHNIQGKIEISARLMNALMRRAGISIDVQISTSSECKIFAKRSDGDSLTASFTIEDARLAGLVKPGGPWVKTPLDMLFARCISRVARQLAPDVIGCCYVEGEISADYSRAPQIETVQIEEPEAHLEDFQEIYLDQQEDFIRYMNAVRDHFSWTDQRTLQEFKKSPTIKLKEKFEEWKRKTTAV